MNPSPITHRNFVGYLLLSIAIFLNHPTFAAEPDSPNDSIAHLAIVFKLEGSRGSIPSEIWMQKQQRDNQLIQEDKILLAGIFQEESHRECITILQPMRRSDAEAILESDPVVKAGFAIATLYHFSPYAPMLGTSIQRKQVETVLCEKAGAEQDAAANP